MLLTRPTKEALAALSQFVETPRWRDVDAFFNAEIEVTTQRLLGARDTADVHELRGRLGVLRDIQQTARDARAMLAKLGQQVPLT